MKAIRSVSLFFVGCVAAACGGASDPVAQSQEVPAGAARQPAVRLSQKTIAKNHIATEAAATRSLRASFSAPARVEFDPDATASSSCLAHGFVVDVKALPGAVVATGDVLFAVESRELGEAQSVFLARSAEVEAKKPLLALAEEAWLRSKALFDESQGIAMAEVRRRESDYRALHADQRIAESAMRAAADQLALFGVGPQQLAELAASGRIHPFHEVRAPIAGQVARRAVSLGDQVGPDSGALVTIVDPKRRHVVAEVHESRAAALVAGMDVAVRAAYGGASWPAKVRYVAPMLDESTRSREVRIDLPEAASGLHPGMFAEVDVFLSASAAAESPIAIPFAAVQTVDRHAVVFVPIAGDAGAFAMRPVEVGAPVDGYVAVTSGLRSGEVVVTEGSFLLKAQATQSGAEQED
jgi:cobalt-zinc-cadmium efflux system membrane fusion protein